GTSGKQFCCLYTFDDQAASTIAASISNLPALMGGTYQPQSPLSAFNGKSAAGPWTIDFCDLAAVDTGIIYDCTIEVHGGTYVEVPFQAAENLSDGGPGGCVAPLTHVANAPA